MNTPQGRLEQLNELLKGLDCPPCQRLVANEIRGTLHCRKKLSVADLCELVQQLDDKAPAYSVFESTGARHTVTAAIGLWVLEGLWHKDAFQELRRRTDEEKQKCVCSYLEKARWR